MLTTLFYIDMKGRRSPASAMMGLGSGLRTMSRGRSRWTKSQQLVVVAFFFICCVIGWLHDLGGTVTSLEEAPLHCSDPVLAAEPMFEGKQKAHNDPEHWLTAAARAKDLQAAAKPGTYVKLFLMIRHGEGTSSQSIYSTIHNDRASVCTLTALPSWTARSHISDRL